jgi:flavin reductase
MGREPLDMQVRQAGEAGASASPSDLGQQDFRNAMARLGAAATIVTTDGPAGRAGFTASAVCSVSDTPPTLLVCLNRGASVYRTFKTNGLLCVNGLAHGQEGIATIFGGKTPMEQRFAAGAWSQLATGAPVLAGAIAVFDCRVAEIVESGTHDVMFCDVVAVRMDASATGLVYFGRRFHGLPGAH